MQSSKKIKILSIFDGIAGARQALKELNVDCEYLASEIDKYAIQIAKANHPDIMHIGDVKDLWFNEVEGGTIDLIDLLIGGSPCQNLSIAGNGKGLKGEKSSLFYEYLRILKEVKPKYFVLENVNSMKKTDKEVITKELWNIEPIMINSALLTAQHRKRLYWIGKMVNRKYEKVDITQPYDKDVRLKDIIESGNADRNKAYPLTATYMHACARDYLQKSHRQMIFDGSKLINRYYVQDSLRKLTPTECCRLQGFADDYCDMVSKSQAYKALGNSFTVPVIKHILNYLI